MGSDAEAKSAATASKWCASQGINLHKALILPVVSALMVWYNCFTPAAWTFLALHGSYGMLWLAKDTVFPDKRFQEPVPFGAALGAFMVCNVAYFAGPWILVSKAAEPPLWYLAAAMFVFTAGMFMMHGSDCQKYYQLKHAPGKLVTNGFFRHVRNPNYLGEAFIYVALAMLTCSLWGMLPIFLAFCVLWLPGMFAKEKSLSRYPEFKEWKESTNLIFPMLW